MEIARGSAARYAFAMHGTPRLTPEILLRAYAEGLFPMAERRGDPTLYWVSPEKRADAQADPEVHRYWLMLPELCVVTVVHETLESLFES